MRSPLDMEPLLLAQLKAAVATLRPAVHVLAADDMAEIVEEKQLVPAIYVLFDGLTPQEAVGPDARVACHWLTVVAVRNQLAKGKGTGGRTEANALLQATYSALAGWKPSTQSKPLELAPAPRGGHSNGFFYLPLAWRTEMVWRAVI